MNSPTQTLVDAAREFLDTIRFAKSVTFPNGKTFTNYQIDPIALANLRAALDAIEAEVERQEDEVTAQAAKIRNLDHSMAQRIIDMCFDVYHGRATVHDIEKIAREYVE